MNIKAIRILTKKYKKEYSFLIIIKKKIYQNKLKQNRNLIKNQKLIMKKFNRLIGMRFALFFICHNNILVHSKILLSIYLFMLQF